MAKKKETKTNAMRFLESHKIPYEMITYDCQNFIDGIHLANALKIPLEETYKTLVTTGKSKNHYVFILPVNKELDFKKAAKAVGEKAIEMLALKDVTTVTGYVRGGCSPLGMKKQFPTVIHDDAQNLDQIYVSGGKLGAQIKCNPLQLKNAIGAIFSPITIKE